MDRFRKSFSDYSSLAVIAAVIICFIFMRDTGTTAALCWLAVVFAVSFFMRPFVPIRNLCIPDAGFAVTFGAGLFLCFYLAWTFSAITGFEFSDAAVYSSFAILAVAGYLIRRFICKKPYAEFCDLKRSLNGFAVFAVIFLAFFWVIGFNPVVDPGTENYMDFAFMQTIYRQKSAIPMDPWFSGTRLNYYYLGQAVSVYMTRLAHTTPEFGYNMMLATFAGMVFMMVFELVSGIAGALFSDTVRKRRCAFSGGVLGGAIAAFGANPHWLLYGIVSPVLGRLFGNRDLDYWFSDATVYISTELGDPDNGKNEFPAYSVILGDLHAHVINVIFVLPLLALLFDICMRSEEDDDKGDVWYKLFLISMLLGYYKGANYWDFAIYFVITGAMTVFFDLKRYGAKPGTFGGIAAKACFVTAVSFVSILPFSLRFSKMESGLFLCENHTSISKLFVLWFLPVAVCVALIVWLYNTVPDAQIKNRAGRSALLASILCTTGLVITPEVIYVKDIYGRANLRFNTMFKLTYQAYILFAVFIGIAFAASLLRSHTVIATVFVVLTIADIYYTPFSCRKWLGDYYDASARSGISSLERLYGDERYSFELRAADVLKQDDARVLNIVEGAGDSYQHSSALSVYSGACTPVGWFVHEWMWHNAPEEVHERADEVSYFYRCGDKGYCSDFLRRYDIDYIFVGPVETAKYAVNMNGFWDLGDVVLDEIRTDAEYALIKVDRSR